jgi:hypothetical protein
MAFILELSNNDRSKQMQIVSGTTIRDIPNVLPMDEIASLSVSTRAKLFIPTILSLSMLKPVKLVKLIYNPQANGNPFTQTIIIKYGNIMT